MIEQTQSLVIERNRKNPESCNFTEGIHWAVNIINLKDIVSAMNHAISHAWVRNGKMTATDGHRLHEFRPAGGMLIDCDGFWKPLIRQKTKVILTKNTRPEQLEYPNLDDWWKRWDLKKFEKFSVQRNDEQAYATIIRAAHKTSTYRFDYFSDLVGDQWGTVWINPTIPDGPLIFETDDKMFRGAVLGLRVP